MDAPAVKKPVTITFWRHLDIHQDPVFVNMVDEFNRTHRDVKVEFVEVPWDREHDMLLEAAAAGNPPDCSDVVEYWIGEWIAKGLLEPLDDYIAGWDAADDFIDGYWDWVRAGKDAPRYIVGGGMGCDLLYYRADLFSEAGLPPPDTLDDFLAAARHLTVPPGRYGFGLRGARVGHRFWGDFARAHGMHFTDPDGRVTLNTPEGVAANQWFLDLYARHRVTPPSSITDSWPQHLEQFTSGQIAILAHTVHLSPLLVAALGDRVAAAMMPAGPGGRWTTFYPQNHAVYRQSKNKEAAWEFVSWLAEAPQVAKWCNNPRRPLLPNVKSLLQGPIYRENPFFRVSLDSMPSWGADPWFHPQFGAYVEKVWPQSIQRALRGDISSQEMMDLLQAHFDGEG